MFVISEACQYTPDFLTFRKKFEKSFYPSLLLARTQQDVCYQRSLPVYITFLRQRKYFQRTPK